MRELYLCGAGNSEGVRLALTLNGARRRWDRLVLLDDDPATHGGSLLGVQIAGPIQTLEQVDPANSEVVNLVARTTGRRWAVRQRIQTYGVPFVRLVHPQVDLTGTDVGSDAVIYQNAVIGPGGQLAEGSVVFMGAVVGHKSRVGPGCVIAPNAVLNARVELGDRVYVGSNATLLPEVRVGAEATIGAGSAVIQDVPAGATAMGVPAQVLVAPGKPPGVAHPLERSAAAPGGELARVIRAIWREVLQVSTFGEGDNFFDLGGNSLLAMQVFERLRQVAPGPVSLTDIFRFPNVRALARHLDSRAEPPSTSAPRPSADLRRRLHNPEAQLRR